MAAVKGANMTKYDAGALGSNWIDKQDIKGTTLTQIDTYEASSLALGSTIDMAQLPTGAKIVGVNLYFDALGASSTLKVGDSNDDDRYIASTASSSAGRSDTLLIDGAGYATGTNSGDTRIIVTTGGASITGTVKLIVTYTV
jgi:hypothetical protein